METKTVRDLVEQGKIEPFINDLSSIFDGYSIELVKDCILFIKKDYISIEITVLDIQEILIEFDFERFLNETHKISKDMTKELSNYFENNTNDFFEIEDFCMKKKWQIVASIKLNSEDDVSVFTVVYQKENYVIIKDKVFKRNIDENELNSFQQISLDKLIDPQQLFMTIKNYKQNY